MQGPNQHNVPAMLLRGFHIHGFRKQIWRFTKKAAPERRSIGSVGSANCFYSDPPSNGEVTLDEKITGYESTEFGHLLNRLKGLPVGAPVISEDAAQAVAHLAPRTAHIRDVLARGMANLVVGLGEVITDDRITNLLGLDNNSPSDRFHDLFAKVLAERPDFEQSGIPVPLLERIAFTLAKENLGQFFEDYRPAIDGMLNTYAAQSERVARESHNRALASDLRGALRRDQLKSFGWRIIGAPSSGAILPDCVAVGYRDAGPPSPYMTIDDGELTAVLVPLSSTKLLVGQEVGAEPPALDDINNHLAQCSDVYFAAATDATEFVELSASIGRRSSHLVDEVIDTVLAEHRPPIVHNHTDDLESGPIVTGDTLNGDEPIDLHPPQMLSYQLTLHAWGDQATADRIAGPVFALVSALSRFMPLQRLDGITFTGDYPAALAELDRGFPSAGPPQTISNDVGVGIAMAPIVVRDGVVKSRVIAIAGLAEALVSENENVSTWAIYTLAYELAQVALIEIVDRALRDIHKKRINDPLDCFLFSAVNSAIDGYLAARITACFAADDSAAAQREVLLAALARARQIIPAERLAYRYHGDLDRLLAAAMPAVRHVLEFVAKLIGHCDALDLSIFDEEGKLASALDQCGLRAWVPVFQTDLECFWQRQGNWESFGEFLSFNRHVERILWQFGLVPWRDPDGLARVQVPLGTDMPALLEAAARGALPAGINSAEAD